jgi:hypothetical protein
MLEKSGQWALARSPGACSRATWPWSRRSWEPAVLLDELLRHVADLNGLRLFANGLYGRLPVWLGGACVSQYASTVTLNGPGFSAVLHCYLTGEWPGYHHFI